MEGIYITENQNETMDVAKTLVGEIRLPCVISLEGDLGAGKTTFTKGLAEGLKIKTAVTSPTFTIMNEYGSGKNRIFHFDFYRLNSYEDAVNLGFNEYFDLKTIKGLVVVEWAERVYEILPENYIKVKIETISENKRKISIRQIV